MGAKAANGAVVEVRIDDLDHEGRGVGRVDDKVVFVDGALPGERVSCRYIKEGRHYDQARLEAVLEASPDRTAPPCPVFGICGGCSLQHLVPKAQVAAKERMLAENLLRTGGLRPDQWLAPIDGPQWAYRAKGRLSVRSVRNKGLLVGFRERASSYVTQMDACPVLSPRLEPLIPALKELVAGLSRPDRIPQAEVADTEGDAVVVIRHLTELTSEDRDRLRAFQAEQGVVVETQSKGPETAAPIHSDRPADLHYGLSEFGVTLRFGSTDFIQVNAGVNRQLVSRAIALLEPEEGERVLDLFCGIGNFSLPAAVRGATVLGLEGEAALVARAVANAEENGVAERTRFATADLGEVRLTDLPGTRECDKVLLDPPRSGAVEAVKQIAEDLRPHRVVYVSCNPATLARDAAVLAHGGYRLKEAGIANMFPHTAHVESMARFELEQAG
ncbi:23S rRNA (uracil(1939)-C(5))-methyltransferase RlmD [Thiohalorhabdus methylotrophus]|uniref:23S rRNA (uracil(1939)-C(5))-methyltransferase RlmD n=1 Tax=Thiohalorhabdus methylotrophus TaxID=3242694 RepID=A0ABV4TXI5_9GAMM